MIKNTIKIQNYEKYLTFAPLPEGLRKSCRAELTGEENLEMGHRYFRGDGVDTDYEKAVQYYRKAMAQGIAEAYFALSFCYRYGKGVEADSDQEGVLLEKAVELQRHNLYRVMELDKKINLADNTENISSEMVVSDTVKGQFSEGKKNYLDRDFKEILFEGTDKICEAGRIKKIIFSNLITENANQHPYRDISEDRDWSVIGWIEPTSGDGAGLYVLHIEGNGNIKAPGNCEGLFSEFVRVEEIQLGSAFDTSDTRNMRLMFSGCSFLRALDISRLDTRNVTNMGCMFLSCTNLERLDISGLDTRNVTNMGGMFCGCSNLKTLDVSGFKTQKVTNMGRMFYGCSSLETVDVSHFDTSNVTDKSDIFEGCTSLSRKDQLLPNLLGRIFQQVLR